MESKGITNDKWRLFAEQLVTGKTATEAYLAAGYKPTTRHTAETSASRLRRQPEVSAYIRTLRDTVTEEAREDAAYSLQQCLSYLTRILDTGADVIPDGDPLIAYSRTFKDGSKATRMPCKLSALKMLCQLAGHFDRPPRPVPPPPKDPMAEIMRQIHSRPSVPIPSQNPAPPPAPQPPPSTDPRATGRTGLSEPAPSSRTPLDPTQPVTRAHANAPITPAPSAPPTDHLPQNNKSPHQNSSFHPPKKPAFTPTAKLTSEPWPDDPVCQALLHGNRPKVVVIR